MTSPTWIVRFNDAGRDQRLRVAVKDIIDMEGVPTTSGSKVIASSARPAESDAPCLAGARAASSRGEAVIVGKTNLHELAFGVTGINPWFGTPVNPLDPSLVPGGSSSGSAVAVACGEADVAYGTDTGGSVRIPAACCGVVGLKTTRGRVSTKGVGALAPSLDTIGPIAMTVGLAARGLALMDPAFTGPSNTASTIGRVRLPADAWIDAAIDQALDAFSESTGTKVIEIDLPSWADATHAAMTILLAEAWGVHAKLWKDHSSDLSADVARRLELASLLEPAEVAEAWEVGRDWAGRLSSLFSAVDVLALPTLAEAPPTIAQAARLSDIRYVAPFNLSGNPALVLPLASEGQLPASMQLTGPGRSEETLLATGAVIEQVAGFTRS
jgi:amidase